MKASVLLGTGWEDDSLQVLGETPTVRSADSGGMTRRTRRTRSYRFLPALNARPSRASIASHTNTNFESTWNRTSRWKDLEGSNRAVQRALRVYVYYSKPKKQSVSFERKRRKIGVCHSLLMSTDCNCSTGTMARARRCYYSTDSPALATIGGTYSALLCRAIARSHPTCAGMAVRQTHQARFASPASPAMYSHCSIALRSIASRRLA